MKLTLKRIVIAAAAASLSGAAAVAAEGEIHIPHQHWHFDGPFGLFDRGALQRGFKVYREVCATCHSLDLVAFRNLGQKGGPFYDEDYPNPNDNPIVKAIAAEYQVEDGPNDEGSMFERPGVPSDRIPGPYPNEQFARLANAGALPPDLSLIVKARAGGADYIYALLTGYLGDGEEVPHDVELQPGMHYNKYFPGHQIAMAPPLVIDGQVTYDDDTEETRDQYARDVAEFLTWAAEPKMEARKQMGFAVMVYLFVLAGLLYWSYKKIWRNVEH